MSLRTQDRGADYFTVDKIGHTQELTPEGFLLCRDVPVARTGTMLYGAGELQDDQGNMLKPGPDGIIRVFRDEPEVFRPETIASLNGKPIVDDHPDEDVNPENWHGLTVGIVLNPRRGDGINDQMLMADLLVTKRAGIEAVKSGKKEVSCGYDASYEQTEPGEARQRHIVYNHVALVDHGRCGPRCSIGDADMKIKVHDDSWQDRVMRLFRSRDEAGMQEMLQNVQTQGQDDDDPEGNGPEGDQHIHIHIPGEGGVGGGGGGGAAGPSAETSQDQEGGGGGGEDIPDYFKQHVAQNNARFDRVEAALSKLGGGSEKTEDEEGGEKQPEGAEADLEKEPDGSAVRDAAAAEQLTDPTKADRTDPGKTYDTAATLAEYRDVVSKAEIICPGVKLATYDAQNPVNATCLLRRRVLAKAIRTGDAAADICAKVMGDKPNLVGMTCDAVTTAFNAVAAMASSRNNGVISQAATYDRAPRPGESGPPSIAELNKKHREFWKDRV